MNVVFISNWWSPVVRGLMAIAVGVATFLWPTITLRALIILFGAYALFDGVFAIIGSVRAARDGERWAILALEGIGGLMAGAIALVWPTITATALVYVIAAWAIFTGVLEIGAAMRLRKHIEGEWLLGLFGVLSVIFGVMIAIVPLAGALTIAFAVGAYAFISGIVLVSLGFRLRTWSRRYDVETRMAA